MRTGIGPHAPSAPPLPEAARLRGGSCPFLAGSEPGRSPPGMHLAPAHPVPGRTPLAAQRRLSGWALGFNGRTSPVFKHLRLKRPLCVLDLETTGTHPMRDRVIEIAVLRLVPRKAPVSFVRRVNPGVP